jgi:DNA-binding IclR family transcriptional regulator
VRRDEHGRYNAGAHLRALAAASLRQDPLHELAGPHLSALARRDGQPRRRGRQRARGLPPAGREPQARPTAGWAGRTIPERGTALGASLRGDVGDGGWIARTGAVEPDVTSIAAPVYGAAGEIAPALSVLAPTFRMTAGRVEACGRAVARRAAELSHSLGYFGAAAA